MNQKNIEKYKFKKGISGNPGGNRGPQLKKRLAKVLATGTGIKVQDKDGKLVEMTAADVLIEKLLLKASEGNLNAIKLILQYVEGMPVQPVQHKGDELEPVIFNINIRNNADDKS